jgi:hypothetical protein
MLRYFTMGGLFVLLGLSCAEADSEANGPPSIVSQPDAEYPLDQIGQVNLDDLLPSEQELALEVIVRDSDVDQNLEFRVFLDAAGFPLDQGDVPPSGTVERPFVLMVPYDALPPGICHKIEMIVVGEFSSFVDPRLPSEPGDVDQATWWIEVVDDANPVVTQACR